MMAGAGQNIGKNFILFSFSCKPKSTFLSEFKIKNNINISLLTNTKNYRAIRCEFSQMSNNVNFYGPFKRYAKINGKIYKYTYVYPLKKD